MYLYCFMSYVYRVAYRPMEFYELFFILSCSLASDVIKLQLTAIYRYDPYAYTYKNHIHVGLKLQKIDFNKRL